MAGERCRTRRYGAGLLAALGLLVATSAAATSSLSFEGGGYWIDLEIGDDAAPVVAAVRFHAPGDSEGVVLPRDEWRVLRFDVDGRRLVLKHAPGRSGVASFTLSVRGADAVLAIDDRAIQSPFAWTP